MKVLLTGSASRLAQALLPQLVADARVSQIIGVDLCETEFRDPRFIQVLLDIRSAALAHVMRGVDALVHTAFVVMQRDLKERRHDREWIRDINVRGSENVFTLAAQQGVRHIVHLSSAAVYELPARSHRIREVHRRQALPGFAYAEDKIAVEDWLDGFEARHPDIRVVRLRPHVILGPHAQPFVTTMLKLPFYVRMLHPHPLTQCVHEDDVSQAVIAALFSDARGPFNLACSDALSFRDMQRYLHNVTVPLPYWVMRRAFQLGWRVSWGTEPSWTAGVRFSVVLDNSRAKKELGWRPKYEYTKTVLSAVKEPAT